MCCKLLGIDELKKPRLKWCDLVQIGVGCGDYENRPESCRTFRCAWLMSPDAPDDERPDKIGVVMFYDPTEHLQVHVDPNRAGAWARGITGQLILGAASKNVVLITTGDDRKAFGREDQLREMQFEVGPDL